MKKIAALVLTFVILISFPVFAAAAEKTEISFDKKSSDDGKIIVDVILSEGGDPCMLQFCVEYDSAVLDCVSAVSGEVFSGISAPIINKTEGKIYLIWDALKPLENGGTVLRLEFSQKSGGKTTAVKIAESEEFIIANSDFEEIGSIKTPLEIVTSGSSIEAEKPEEKPSESENSQDETSSADSGNSASEKEPSEQNSSEEPQNSQKESGASSAVEEDEKNESSESENASQSSEREDGEKENVLVVESPRAERKEQNLSWIWIAVGAAAVLVTVSAVVFIKNVKKQ